MMVLRHIYESAKEFLSSDEEMIYNIRFQNDDEFEQLKFFYKDHMYLEIDVKHLEEDHHFSEDMVVIVGTKGECFKCQYAVTLRQHIFFSMSEVDGSDASGGVLVPVNAPASLVFNGGDE